MRLGVHDHEVAVIEGIVDMAQKTLSMKKAHTRKRKKNSAAEEGSSDSSESDADDVPRVNRRLTGKGPEQRPIGTKAPQSSMKARKPSTTKPALSTAASATPVASASSTTSSPVPTFDKPIWYNGGRIYWSKPRQQWRVYARAGDKVEKKVDVVNTTNSKIVKKLWRKALAFIDNDNRPR